MEDMMTDQQIVLETIKMLNAQLEEAASLSEEELPYAPTPEWIEYIEAMVSILERVKNDSDISDYAVVCKQFLDIY